MAIAKRNKLGQMMPIDLAERFVEKVEEPFDGHNDCCIWKGSKTGSGYGQIWVGGRHVTAHRIAHELFIGPIPEGHAVDHLCRNRLCVRPDHLEPLPHYDNWSQFQWSKTHCLAGHPYDEENTYRYRGERQCRICRREAVRRYQQRKRGF